ncbi:DUF2382 domain-containing protein [Knoellia sp. CPCC 206435]|uniref:DUF2382 domain-containing protein n=1 Tax=Knoellia terrae TaxID=3404797 RepID=UPI003B433124
MLDENQIQSVMGNDVYSSDGEKIGRAGTVYLDDQSGRPEWVTVNTGLFGMNESFVPLESATFGDDRLTVPFTKDVVKDAPNVNPDEGHLDPEEEERLYRHYGVSGGVGGDIDGDQTQTAYATGGVDDDADLGRGDRGDTSGPDTDNAMTRSEERLRVGTEARETGRARLRKYVTTEQQQVTVPVSREEVRVEREPITDANRDEAMAGPAISEEEHEITLHEERPVVATEAVPVERVSLGKETVTEQEQVSGEVRKEQIEADGVDETRGTRDR